MSDPTFTEDEARRILARATERQESVERAQMDSGGSMTLAELTSIAREVDIDVDHVRAAATEVVMRRSSARVPTTLGIPREITGTRVLPGQVSAPQWERMVEIFRASFGVNGVASQYGGVREWTSSTEPDSMPVQVRLEAGKGGTLLSFRQSTHTYTVKTPRTAGVLVAFGLVMVLLGLAGVTGELGPGFGGLVASTASVIGLGSLFAGRHVVAEQRLRFESVADKVELIGRSDA